MQRLQQTQIWKIKNILRVCEGIIPKNFTVTILSDVHKNQKEFQESKEFKELSKERYKIEAKNSELKNAHGYGRSVGNGLYETKIQGACVIFVTNLKRITTLMNENKKK